MPRSLRALEHAVVGCRACPRLVAWREQVAREKVARFRQEDYWGLPVPGFGDPHARLLFVGLAPAAHGANRTGRVFTGDRSGDFLFAALHRAGLASQPTSRGRDDGLVLRDAYVLTAVRCAPPGNKPKPDEIARCAHFLDEELAALPSVRVVVALGAIAWNACLDSTARAGLALPRPRPPFAHGASLSLPSLSTPHTRPAQSRHLLLGSYHVSQQNTQTGRLTSAMFDSILDEARRLAHRDTTG